MWPKTFFIYKTVTSIYDTSREPTTRAESDVYPIKTKAGIYKE